MRRVGLPDSYRRIEPELYFDPAREIPENWMPRGRWKSGPMHTFCDDYRQEFFWRRPEESAMIALLAGIVTAPDYTVWLDDPPQWRAYQAWRSALVGAYWQAHGVSVLPVVSFRSCAHRYVKKGSAWAIRGSSEPRWAQELQRWLRQAKPGLLVVF